MKLITPLAATLLALLPLGPHAASFDCAKARLPEEKAICASPELSRMDDQLGHVYRKAREVTGNSAAFRKTVDDNWLKRRGCGGNTACIRNWYSNSFALYQGIVDDASAVTPLVLKKIGLDRSMDTLVVGTIRLRDATDIAMGREVPTKFPAIVTDKPVTVWMQAFSERDKWVLKSDRVFQLHISERADYDTIRRNVGRKAALRCSLWQGQNAHHFTDCLCTVKGYTFLH